MTATELTFNRLAAAELRPTDGPPPWWHRAIDHFGLFTHYFASTLAIGLIGYTLYRLRRNHELFGASFRWLMIPAGAIFLVLAVTSVAISPGESMSFWFESSFITVLIVLCIAQARPGGDLGAKIGIVVLVIPMVIHYYGPFAAHVLDNVVDGSRLLDLPERMRSVGQWALIMAALVTPYCLAPRPFLDSAARIGPFVVAMFVGVIGLVIIRQHYEEGMQLAQHGLGIYIGPSAPTEYLAVYLIALGTMTWTITACLTADAMWRREIGVGLGLIVVGGYSFAWPLQYLVGLVGLLGISEAARRVPREERQPQNPAPTVHAPPILDSVWQRYVGAAYRALGEPQARDVPGAAGDAPDRDADQADGERRAPRAGSGVVTVRRDDGCVVTHLVTWRGDIPIALRVERLDGAIVCIEILCGRETSGPPAWTLYARPERLLGIGAHAEPPKTTAPVIKLDDRPFDDRFRVRDAGDLTAVLMDSGLRARAAALIDGWLAFWPGKGLRYRVEPGHGAPLDHPIPTSELAFRGNRAEPSVDRLVMVIDLLADMARRGLSPKQ